jgi:DDE family transposase
LFRFVLSLMAQDADFLGWTWDALGRFLPFDLDAFAFEHRALKRRRGVKDGGSLMQLCLMCALPKMKFGQVAHLAKEMNLAELSGVALFKRFCHAEKMLQSAFAHVLSHAAGPVERFAGYRVLAVDGSSLCGPGATQTDQRLHVVYDLGRGLPVSVDLTTIKGGETLRRHESFGKDDLILGDSIYGNGPGVKHALDRDARVLVRFEFESIRLLDEDGQKIWPEPAKARVPESGAIEFAAFIPGCARPLRVFGERNPKGEVVWLLTDLTTEELPLNRARALYMRRWQIELFFKRLKSLLDLDELPSRDGPSARAWIWAKLLLAALLVLVSHERFSPWGRPYEAGTEPLEGVRVCHGRRNVDSLSPPTAKTKTRTSAKKTPPLRPALQTALPLGSVTCLS